MELELHLWNLIAKGQIQDTKQLKKMTIGVMLGDLDADLHMKEDALFHWQLSCEPQYAV